MRRRDAVRDARIVNFPWALDDPSRFLGRVLDGHDLAIAACRPPNTPLMMTTLGPWGLSFIETLFVSIRVPSIAPHEKLAPASIKSTGLRSYIRGTFPS
jgi:hypothetical protein